MIDVLLMAVIINKRNIDIDEFECIRVGRVEM